MKKGEPVVVVCVSAQSLLALKQAAEPALYPAQGAGLVLREKETFLPSPE